MTWRDFVWFSAIVIAITGAEALGASRDVFASLQGAWALERDAILIEENRLERFEDTRYQARESGEYSVHDMLLSLETEKRTETHEIVIEKGASLRLGASELTWLGHRQRGLERRLQASWRSRQDRDLVLRFKDATVDVFRRGERDDRARFRVYGGQLFIFKNELDARTFVSLQNNVLSLHLIKNDGKPGYNLIFDRVGD